MRKNIKPKNLKDFLAMNANCSPAISGDSHNFTGYFNYIVDANAWDKIKKPLYKNLSIRLANGALGNGQAQIITIDEFQQKKRKEFKQYSAENDIAGKTSAIYIFIVRKGIDQMYTPQLNVSFSKPLMRDGYYYTEYKP